MSDSAGGSKKHRFADWAGRDEEPAPLIPAATVVVVRDTPDGLETLMMRRSSKLSFVGGMWVFPGGRVDDGDYPAGRPDDILAASRTAAVREAAEEADLAIDPANLVPYSHWVPPPSIPKRFATWFFLAPAPAGVVTVDGGEIKEHAWWRPSDTLDRHAAGDIEIVPPTFITLRELAGHATVDYALAAARTRSSDIPRYATRITMDGGTPVSLWHGDAGYDTSDAGVPGPRHRLTMAKSGWRLEQT